MGQPIIIKKGGETATVYGQAQLAQYLADGWQLSTGEETAVSEEQQNTAVSSPKPKRKGKQP